MKTIKPDKLGLLTRVFENDQRCYLAVAVLVGTKMRSPKSLVSEVAVWKTAAEALAEEGGILDEGYPKPSSEVLVTGRCYAPRGKAVPATTARVQIGAIDKRVAVFGDRFWQKGSLTDPVPFESMPLGWAHAFGGKGFAANPAGRGFAPVELEDGSKVHPLPNVELPGRLILSPGDRPTPAGFGALDIPHVDRQARAGSYDRTWLETRSPGLPVDFNLDFFHAAPRDQWLEGFFLGDESFVLENLHPTEPRLEGRLPGVVVRAFAVLDADVPPGPKIGVGQGRAVPRAAMREIALRAETVRFFPEAELAVVVHRGVIEVAEDDADDCLFMLLAAEDPTAPREVDHYHEVLMMRLDPEKYPWALTRDSDLVPPVELGWASAPERGDIADLVDQEHLLKKNLDRGMTAHIDAKRAELAPKGLWVEPPAEEAPDDLDMEGAFRKMEEVKARAKKEEEASAERVKALKARAKEAFARQGLDYEAEVAKAKKEAAGPPKFKAKKHVAQMREIAQTSRDAGAPMVELEGQLADPAWMAELTEQEQRLLGAYKMNAHRQEAVDPAATHDSDLARGEAKAAREAGASLAGRDFTGVDFSGLDLSGLDLSHALLESANLTKTNLTGANLTGAVLAHARIVETTLVGAKLAKANLGSATMDGADLSGCDFTDAIFTKARLTRLQFAGAKLERTQLLETVFEEGVDFGGAKLIQVLFMKLDLRACRFAKATILQSNFLECDLSGCDLTEADVGKTGFLKSNLSHADLTRARVENAQFVPETSLEGATLTGISGARANFREANMKDAALTGAQLTECDLSKADFTGADLRGAVLRGSLLMRTNFTEATATGADLLGVFASKAVLVGADFRGANLFGADLSRVQVDGRTKIDRADLRRARVFPKRKEGGSSFGSR